MSFRFLSFWLFFMCCLDAHPIMDRIRSGQAVILRHGPLDTTDADVQLQKSIDLGISFEIDGNIIQLNGRQWFVNAHSPGCYAAHSKPFPCQQTPAALHPAPLLVRIADSGIVVKCDYKSSKAIIPLAFASQVVPSDQKIGHMFLRELIAFNTHVPAADLDEFLTFEDLDLARQLQGEEVPFVVSCSQVSPEMLTEDYARQVAALIQGRAECLQFCLPNRRNIPVEIAQLVWKEYGIIPEMRIDSAAERAYWDRQGIPYIGTTDDPDLATFTLWED